MQEFDSNGQKKEVVTANAGLNLNTSLLALENGNLASLAGALAGNDFGSSFSSDNFATYKKIRVKMDSGGGTAVTANAGLNLNTSLLALEAGNLATLAGKDFATQTTLGQIKAKTDNIPASPSTENGNLALLAGTILGNDFGSSFLPDAFASFKKIRVKIDSGGGTSVVANAGTNLNTSLLALEAGNLATIAGKDFATQTTLSQIKTDVDNIPPLGQAALASCMPVVLPSTQITTLTPPAAITNYAKETGGYLSAIKSDVDNIPPLGQAALASCWPVALPSTQITTLTPPAAITNYAKETGGYLSAIKSDVDNIPPLGQAALASCWPVALPSTQITTLTPPAAITNYAKETGGYLSVLATNVPPLGQTVAASCVPVVLPSSQITTLTPPAAITNYALEAGGNLAILGWAVVGNDFGSSFSPDNFCEHNRIRVKVDAGQSVSGGALESGGNLDIIRANTPPLGQAVASSCSPVVLPTSQITTLTPPAAITNYALETTGNLANLASTILGDQFNYSFSQDNFSNSNKLNVNDISPQPSSVNNNRVTVPSAGTRVQFAYALLKSMVIKALVANTGTIYVGGQTVSSANGFQLAAGDVVAFDINNASAVWIDSSVNGEGVSWLGIY